MEPNSKAAEIASAPSPFASQASADDPTAIAATSHTGVMGATTSAIASHGGPVNWIAGITTAKTAAVTRNADLFCAANARTVSGNRDQTAKNVEGKRCSMRGGGDFRLGRHRCARTNAVQRVWRSREHVKFALKYSPQRETPGQARRSHIRTTRQSARRPRFATSPVGIAAGSAERGRRAPGNSAPGCVHRGPRAGERARDERASAEPRQNRNRMSCAHLEFCNPRSRRRWR